MKLVELKDVIKDDLILYDCSNGIIYDNVDVLGDRFDDFKHWNVLSIRTGHSFGRLHRKDRHSIVVSISRPLPMHSTHFER